MVTKHWLVLLGGYYRGIYTTLKTVFVYRRAPNVRDRLVHNVPDPPKKFGTFLDHKGFYTCGKCKPCRTVKNRTRHTLTFQSNVTQKLYPIKKLITCQSTHVTYLLSCPCGQQYAGCTTRRLAVRLGEHVNNIKKRFRKHSLSNNFRISHNRDPTLLTFCGIDKIDNHWRSIDMHKAVSRNETRWIYELCTMSPQGMNIYIDINCFITNI